MGAREVEREPARIEAPQAFLELAQRPFLAEQEQLGRRDPQRQAGALGR
jgi:hypothetical protein